MKVSWDDESHIWRTIKNAPKHQQLLEGKLVFVREFYIFAHWILHFARGNPHVKNTQHIVQQYWLSKAYHSIDRICSKKCCSLSKEAHVLEEFGKKWIQFLERNTFTASQAKTTVNRGNKSDYCPRRDTRLNQRSVALQGKLGKAKGEAETVPQNYLCLWTWLPRCRYFQYVQLFFNLSSILCGFR